ncbi:TPA: type 1 fimbrial protein [Pseudomonas aeruginosa]|nr:type 1 fimbrial protein [Pseudomonas aeruginosa]
MAKKKLLTSAGNSDWVELTNTEKGKYVKSPATLGVAVAVRLIKIGPILPGTQLKRTEVAKGTSYVSSYPDLSTHINIGPIDFIVPTCQTRNVDVMLGEVYMGKFSGVGSEAGTQDFAITLENCPAGFNKITYRLDSLNEVIDANKGLIQIDKVSGNASGIAIRIQGQGSALKFGTEQELSSYNGAKGSYDIPLSASYYQTGPITPGTANASIEFKISYQ